MCAAGSAWCCRSPPPCSRPAARAAGVASELVATRADLEAFIAGQAVDSDRPHPLLTGWRRELAGESLLRLLRGEISLRVLPGPPHVAES